MPQGTLWPGGLSKAPVSREGPQSHSRRNGAVRDIGVRPLLITGWRKALDMDALGPARTLRGTLAAIRGR